MELLKISLKMRKHFLKHQVPCLMTALILFILASFQFLPIPVKNAHAGDVSEGPVVYLAMILGRGGLGDRSFNDSAFEGLRDSQKQYGIRFEIINFISENKNIDRLRDVARQEFDLIIGIGFENKESIQTVAKEFPNSNFALIDVISSMPNIASIVFREQEGDFLMGALAAMLSKTKIVGFVGGMDIPVIRRIEKGFKQGVYYQDPDIKIIADIAGTFTDTQIGETIALGQYEQGADIIYNAAGRTGLGVIEAAKKLGNLTIGTSGNQIYLAPGHVVGNRPKRVDKAVLELTKMLKTGKFVAGVYSFGLKEEGVGIGPFDMEIVKDDMLKRIEALRREIINGTISIDVGDN